MSLSKKRRWLIAFIIGAIVSTVCPNPFHPDVCTSSGFGVPFPTAIRWCECKREEFQLIPSGIAWNAGMWGTLALAASFAAGFRQRQDTPGA